jgi:hypothetical protein
MTISFRCPFCSTELSFDDMTRTESPCPKCEKVIPLYISEKMRQENIVDHCAICGLEKLYIQKDFNRTLGVSIFVGCAILSLILYGYHYVLTSFLVLGGAAAADYLLYMALPEVTICYKCHAQYRGVTSNPANEAFELGLAEKHDPLDKNKGAENPAAEWKQR